MIIGIHKPKGPTSHDVINQVRKITHERRVGHAGTLDPMASGVLVVAITRESTKQLTDIVEHDKEYIATIQLGATSTTDDGEGIISLCHSDRSGGISPEGSLDDARDDITSELVKDVLNTFVGNIKQAPPAYSAINVGGKKSYDLARSGRAVNLGLRDVTIHLIELVSYSWPELMIKVHCGSGVYIRSLARDIGEKLGVGAYMSALERTRVGNYRVEDCLTIETFEKTWREKSV